MGLEEGGGHHSFLLVGRGGEVCCLAAAHGDQRQYQLGYMYCKRLAPTVPARLRCALSFEGQVLLSLASPIDMNALSAALRGDVALLLSSWLQGSACDGHHCPAPVIPVCQGVSTTQVCACRDRCAGTVPHVAALSNGGVGRMQTYPSRAYIGIAHQGRAPASRDAALTGGLSSST